MVVGGDSMRYEGWIAAGLVLLAAAGAWAWYASSSGTRVDVAEVRGQEIRTWVDEQGKTRLPRIQLVTMPFDGRIAEITLRERDRVTKNEVVARTVLEEVEVPLAEADAAVQRLDAAIRQNDDATVEETARKQAQFFVESMTATVQAAEARKEAGLAKKNFAESELARIAKLVPTGARTQSELERAQVDFVQSKVDYQQDVLVWRAAEAIEAATKLLPKLVSQYIDRKALNRAVLEKEKAEAEARRRQLEIRKERGTTRAEFDGLVLTREIEHERNLAAGTVLLTLGRLDELEIEADLLSQDVVAVHENDEVEIYGPAIGGPLGKGVAGRVARIFPAGFTKLSSLGVEQQRVKVIVHFAEGVLAKLLAARGLGVDHRVRVRIYTSLAENALVVPRSALFRGPAGDWRVFAIRAGRAAIQPVTIGLMNDDAAQITQGIAAGEKVVLTPESSLREGDWIRARVE
jgi:HlyD family secretion protein